MADVNGPSTSESKLDTEEERITGEVAEEAVDVTKGLFKAAADLISKTGVVRHRLVEPSSLVNQAE